MNTENFVFEIGVEEIPARFLPIFEKEIEHYFIEQLSALLLSYTKYIIIATPRRIGIYIENLEQYQGKKEERLLGPSVAVARNANGDATPALLGFLKKTGVAEQDTFTVTTEKGEYIATDIHAGGKETITLLPALCEQAILHLSTIQKMRWGTSSEVFARPIQWLLALYGTTGIECSYGECATTSPQCTYGHRILAPQAIRIESAQSYLKTIEDVGHVLPTTAQRLKRIQQGIHEIEQQCGGTLVMNETLLEENVNLCEYPYVLLGDVEQKYGVLPKEIFLTSIESHQRSFGIVDAQGVLLPYFITILNNDATTSPYIKKGWERVLRARLEDAMFFFENDSRASFSDWLHKLEHVTFITTLGTMRERSLRLQALALHLSNSIMGTPSEEIARAGLLCKADLVSGIVGEFDTLQGIMGGIYALQKGEPTEVARGISEHYLPSGSTSPVPTSIEGTIIALADKIDMLVGCFGMNMIPTGTADTQGLRRATLGIIRIILENSLTISLAEVFSYARTLYGDRQWKMRDDDTLQALETFFTVRAKNYFLSCGFETVCIDAVLPIDDTLPALYARLKALKAFLETPKAMETFLVFKRCSNIIASQKETYSRRIESMYSPSLFEEEAEKALHAIIERVIPAIQKNIASMEYEVALTQAQELYAPLHTFFDSVLVLAEKEDVRINRLQMLHSISSTLEILADFKALQV